MVNILIRRDPEALEAKLSRCRRSLTRVSDSVRRFVTGLDGFTKIGKVSLVIGRKGHGDKSENSDWQSDE
jgi:hypothetical protein